MISDRKITDIIPEVSLNNFCSDPNGFLLLSVKDFICKTTIEPHRTSYYQLVLITDGNGKLGINTSEYNLEPKTCFAVAKNMVETFEPEENISGVVLIFSEEYVYKNPEDSGYFNHFKLFDNYIEPCVINLSDKEYFHLLKLISGIKSELVVSDDFLKEDIVLNYLKLALLSAERIKRKIINSHPEFSEDNSFIVEFRNIIEEQFRSSKNVNYYAGLLHITVQKLNKLTKNSLGKSPKKIIEERILLEAKRLLKHTDLSVKEISGLLGFNDPTNFNKFFKRYNNITPFKFRSSIKNIN